MTDPQQPEHEPTTRERLIDVWAKAAAGWRRWEPHLIAFSTPVTARLIALLEFSGDEHLLDIGCGFGEPATTIAPSCGSGRTISLRRLMLSGLSAAMRIIPGCTSSSAVGGGYSASSTHRATMCAPVAAWIPASLRVVFASGLVSWTRTSATSKGCPSGSTPG